MLSRICVILFCCLAITSCNGNHANDTTHNLLNNPNSACSSLKLELLKRNISVTKETKNNSWPVSHNINLYSNNKNWEHSKTISYNYSNDFTIGPAIGAQKGKLFVSDNSGNISAYSINDDYKLSWNNSEFNKNNSSHFYYGGMTISQNKLYATAGTNKVLSLNINDGKVIWAQNLNSISRAKPIIDKTNLYIKTIDNNIYALSLKTGKVQWVYWGKKHETNIIEQSSLLQKDNFLINQDNDGSIVLIDKTNGSVHKEINTTTPDTSTISNNLYTPPATLHKNNIITFDSKGNMALVDLKTHEVVWSITPHYQISGIAIDNAYISITKNNHLLAIDLKTGKKIWCNALKHNSNRWEAVRLINKHIYTLSFDGYLIKTNPKSGKIIKSRNIGHQHSTDLIVVNGSKIIPANNFIYIY